MTQEIIIKNMVCLRCIEAVKKLFQEMGLEVLDIRLGKVTVSGEITPAQRKTLGEQLEGQGFRLLEDRQARLVSEIKSILIKEIHHKAEARKVNYSTLLAEKLHYDYAHLSRLFSSVEGKTIEKYIMAQKIEKVKELLVYDELSLSEIAFDLDYSSTAHLSAQFKKVTGMTPTAFKRLHNQHRKRLDDI